MLKIFLARRRGLCSPREKLDGLADAPKAVLAQAGAAGDVPRHRLGKEQGHPPRLAQALDASRLVGRRADHRELDARRGGHVAVQEKPKVEPGCKTKRAV